MARGMQMACNHLGTDINCEHAVNGDSVDEVADKLMAHIRQEHSDRLAVEARRNPQQLERFIRSFLQLQSVHAGE